MPIELHQHHLVVAKGSIGPLNDLNLLIDTGTIPSMVDIRIGRKLHLQAQPSALVAFGQQIRVQSAIIDGFRLGPLQSGPLPVGVGDLSYLEGVRIDAIVGLDVLSGTNFSIDYHSQVLKFAPDTRENAVARLEVVWPFVTVRMAISDEPVRLLVDTGSSDLVLFKTQLPAAISRGPWGGEKDRTVCIGRGPPAARRTAPGRAWSGDLGQTARLGARQNPRGVPPRHRRRARRAGSRLPARPL